MSDTIRRRVARLEAADRPGGRADVLFLLPVGTTGRPPGLHPVGGAALALVHPGEHPEDIPRARLTPWCKVAAGVDPWAV